MMELLEHPLFLLLVGAALTGLIIPAITRQWQIRQKKLEVKTELVSEVSESVVTFFMAIQLPHIAADRYPDKKELLRDFQSRLDDAYAEWEVKSSVIGTKLQAFLSSTPIPRDWTDFCDVMRDFYALEGLGGGAIQTFADKMTGKLSELLGEKKINLLNGREDGTLREEIKEAILKAKSKIIADILATDSINVGEAQ